MRQAVQSGITRKALVSKVIPNPHPDFVTLTGKKKFRSNTRVLFVAANLNSQIKNLKCLIEALKILKSDLIELNLVGFGAGPGMEEISSYTEVKFRGISSEEEIQRIMEECDILVVPSKSENFPNVILEAFVSGLVVVAASVGGIPEMIDDQINGYLYDGSSEELSKKLEYAIADKDNWEQLREKAKDKLNQDFSNVNISEETLEIYRMLIADHKELNVTHVD
jgi:glycosyltransferase involved in cell wall biosynthesis